jgi:REP-associated tyrosine transposase
VTFCTAKRGRTFLDPQLARVVVREIKALRESGLYWLYAYCVMPDHVHLVMKLRHSGLSLSQVVGRLRAAITRGLRARGKSIGWQRGYFDRVVREYETSREFILYVLRNPNRAGLCGADDVYEHVGTVDSWF